MRLLGLFRGGSGRLATDFEDSHASLAFIGRIPFPSIFNDAMDEIIVEQHFEEFNLLVAQSLLYRVKTTFLQVSKHEMEG